MKYRMPAMYEEFHCLGGDCPDNCCCIGWEVSIDEETAARYRALEGPLGDKLRETMVEADGEMQFPLTKGSCPFLDGDRLCSLHREYGEEFLCRTCREYPRFTNEYGELIERGLSFSCPEAAQMMLSNPKPITFTLKSDDEPVTKPNDIPAELFLQLRPLRQQLMGILQDRSMPVWMRAGICLKLARKAQERIDQRRIGSIAKLREKYSRLQVLEKQKAKLQKKEADGFSVRVAMSKRILQLEPLTGRWTGFWEQIRRSQKMELMLPHHADIEHHALAQMMRPREYEYEHFLVYLIYRYFLEGVYEGDVYWRVKFAVFSLLAVAELDLRMMQTLGGELPQAAQADLMSLYSKEIEHSPDNMAALKKALTGKGKFGRRELIAALRDLLDAE